MDNPLLDNRETNEMNEKKVVRVRALQNKNPFVHFAPFAVVPCSSKSHFQYRL